MHMLDDHEWIAILDFVKVIGSHSNHLSHDGHPGSLTDRGRIEKLLLDRKKTSLRLLTIVNRPILPIERQLEQFELGAVLEALAFQHFTSDDKHSSWIGLRRSQQLSKGHRSVDQLC